MKDIEKVMSKISPHILGKCDKKYKEECVEMVEEDLVELVNQTLETQALALEERKEPCIICAKKGVIKIHDTKENRIWQQAADYLRSQKIKQ